MRVKAMSNLPPLAVVAAIFAGNAHSKQTRKYTHEPYIVHPREVVRILYDLKIRDEATLAAAWLHDVVEDTDRTLDQIRKQFGDEIAMLVEGVTDVSTPRDGNRVARKAIDREHLRHADPRAKNIKLADLTNNTLDIFEHDPGFAMTYIPEKLLLLEVLKEGSDQRLWRLAHRTVLRSFEQLRLVS